jgi:ribonucleotide reductase alpha subunit
MEIVDTTKTVQLRLREEFLEPYRQKGDPFNSLLARSTYLTKYCRGGVETWTDTIKRVVEGNVNLAPGVTENEAQLLFHVFWTGQALPPGRGLWTGGVEGIPADARYNCWYATLSSLDDWCWIANQLMLGGGVGVGLQDIGSLPVVPNNSSRFAIWCRPDHKDIAEVIPEGPSFLNGTTPIYRVADSREGWVTALRRVLTAAYEGNDLVIDVSDVRNRGSLIRTFGGIACGPGPLANLLRASWKIIRGAAGRRLNSVECLDITNHIGLCIKSGNVRRSALIVLGPVEDQEFRNAKKDFEAVISHRHTSNNSIAFRSSEQIENFDWKGLVEDNIHFGEPGILNLPLVWRTDPGAQGVNPCFSGDTLIAVADGRNAVPIRQLAEEGVDVPVYSVDKTTGKVEIKLGRNPRVTGRNKKLLRVWLDDGSYLDTTPDHKFLLLNGVQVKAQDLVSGMSLPRFSKRLEPVKQDSKDYYRIYCNTLDSRLDKVFEHRLIAKFYNPVEWDRIKASSSVSGYVRGGIVIHHKDFNQLNNFPDNLQLMTFKDHVQYHSSIRCDGEKNGHFSGVASKDVKAQALELTASLGRRFSRKDWLAFAKTRCIPQQFSSFRKGELGSVLTLAKVCAIELGYEHCDEDPRVVRTYESMLRQGYKARIFEGSVFVKKTCEMCGKPFEVVHQLREHSFCSEACSSIYINSDPDVRARRVESIHSVYQERMKGVRVQQARVCSDLKFSLGRYPTRKEWSIACKSEGVPSRIGPTLKFGFKRFDDILQAGDSYNHKVRSVEELPQEHTVYNITVNDFHTVAVITNVHIKRGNPEYFGIFTPQCGEVPLHNKESCNLAEVFPSKFNGSIEHSLIFRLVTRYSLRQRIPELQDPEADRVRKQNMRVGVGLGGLCDFSWSAETLAKWFGLVRQEADSYADELGVNRPIAVTTVKPSGTISLLNGSSPGIHAPHAPYYIRRTRIAKNDPMAMAMMEAGVPFDEDVYDTKGNTWVFEFPTKAAHTKSSSKTETVREQFQRQATVQEWWADNAVSATLNFTPDTERGELADCLKEFVPRLKSTSCLPRTHGYKQPPYEEIDELTYHRMSSLINNNHPLVHGGDIEVEECSSGACPAR